MPLCSLFLQSLKRLVLQHKDATVIFISRCTSVEDTIKYWTSIGIMLANAAESACPDVLTIFSSNSNILSPSNLFFPPILACLSHMVPRCSSLLKVIHLSFLMMPVSTESKKLFVPSSTMTVQWTTNSWLPSEPSLLGSPKPLLAMKQAVPPTSWLCCHVSKWQYCLPN